MQTAKHQFEVNGQQWQIWSSTYPSSGALAVILNPIGRGGYHEDSVVISVNMDHGQDHESKDLPLNCFYVPIWREELAPYLEAAERSPFFKRREDLPVSHSGYVSSPAWEYIEYEKHHVHESKCPSCEAVLDGAANMAANERERPSPGDFSVCMYCATILIFDDNLELQTASSNALEQLEPGQLEAITKMQELIKEGK